MRRNVGSRDSSPYRAGISGGGGVSFHAAAGARASGLGSGGGEDVTWAVDSDGGAGAAWEWRGARVQGAANESRGSPWLQEAVAAGAVRSYAAGEMGWEVMGGVGNVWQGRMTRSTRSSQMPHAPQAESAATTPHTTTQIGRAQH